MKIFIKTLRILSIIVIVINTIIIAGYVFAAHSMMSMGSSYASSNGVNVGDASSNTVSLFGQIFQKWTENPLNFANADVMFVNRSILLYLIPILILIFVKYKKVKKEIN